MGSDQSTQGAQKEAQRRPQRPPVRRGHTIATSSRQEISRNIDRTASGNDSPGASMCSDSELPYISYTVGRPIGDSPKHTSKPRSAPVRRHSVPRQRPRDIIVVRQAERTESDSALSQLSALQRIPTFLPIMRGTLGLPGARDPDVLEGLDPSPWSRLSARYQAHLAACAQQLLSDQLLITAKIKEVDADMSRLHAEFADRQRSNARNAERLSRARDMSHQLNKIKFLVHQSLQDAEELNDLLPDNKRLQPFEWSE